VLALVAKADRVVAATVERAGIETAEVADAGDRDREQAVEKLVHARVAKRDRDSNGHLLAELEVRNRLARPAHVGTLPRDHGQLLGGRLEHRGVLLGVADAHVQGDLLDARRLHGRRVTEPLDERGADLVHVALLEARHELRLCDGH
jgi:hypothetical protein